MNVMKVLGQSSAMYIISIPSEASKQAMLCFCSPAADGPILGLPGKEIEKGCKRLSDEREGDPENAVPDDPSIDTLHLLQRCRDGDEWQLSHHTNKRNT